MNVWLQVFLSFFLGMALSWFGPSVWPSCQSWWSNRQKLKRAKQYQLGQRVCWWRSWSSEETDPISYHGTVVNWDARGVLVVPDNRSSHALFIHRDFLLPPEILHPPEDTDKLFTLEKNEDRLREAS